MIFYHSKLPLVILALVSATLLSVLALEVYNIQIMNQKASELAARADEAARARNLVRSIKAIQDSAAEDLRSFDNLVLSDDKLVPLIDGIEGVGRALDLNVDIVSVGKVESKKPAEPNRIRIAIETQGPWAKTLSFLSAIENLPNRVMIEESSLSKLEAGWHSRIILSLYLFN